MQFSIMLSSLATAIKYQPEKFKNYTGSTVQEFIEQFSDTDWDLHDAVKNYLHGDLNLLPVTWVTDIKSQFTGNSITFITPETNRASIKQKFPDSKRPLLHAFIEGLKQVSALDDEQHMELFKQNHQYHDGGDDLDYASSYYIYLEYMLETLDKLVEGTIGIQD